MQLGFGMTPTAVKTMMNRKIKAVLKRESPQDCTETKSLVGAANFYKSLWPHQAHNILAPFSELTGNKPFVWDKRKEKAFKEMKALLAAKFVNKDLDYTKTVHIYTNASDYQLAGKINSLISKI